jgi:hypothetical protein
MEIHLPKIRMFNSNYEEFLFLKNIKKKNATEYRMVIMSIGMIQLFNTLISIGIEWPPIIYEIIALLSIVSFNFEFFHPECSAETEYYVIWLFLTLMPYIMLVPLTMAYIACKMFL